MLHPFSIPLSPQERDTRYEMPVRTSVNTYHAARRIAAARGVQLKDVVDAALAAYAMIYDRPQAHTSSNSTDHHSLEKDGLSGGKTRKARAIDRLPPKARERK